MEKLVGGRVNDWIFLFFFFYSHHYRREQWPLFSSYACWQQLVTQTRNLSRDHVALSEVYSTHLVSRLAQVMEDVQRIYKRVSGCEILPFLFF